MKMKQEHYQVISQKIAELFSREDGFEKRYHAAGLSPTRLRWDVLRASGVKFGSSTNLPVGGLPLYDYLNDDHIDTALRAACKEAGSVFAHLKDASEAPVFKEQKSPLQTGSGEVVQYTAFHGSKIAGIDTLNPSERGTFGSGIYLGDRNCAYEYADGGDEGELLEFQVSLRKPYTFLANFEHGLDLDSPAVDLIRELFDQPKSAELLTECMETDALFGHVIQNRLQQLGYDGLMVDYGDNAFELVVFDVNALKLADRVSLQPDAPYTLRMG